MKVSVISLFVVIAASYAGETVPMHPKLDSPTVKTWTFKELLETIQFKIPPYKQLRPYLEAALNKILFSLLDFKHWRDVLAAVPSPSGKETWTYEELQEFKKLLDMDIEMRSSVNYAYDLLEDLKHEYPNKTIEDIPVVIAAVDISTWTQSHLEEALADHTTVPELIPHLEKALNKLKQKSKGPEDTVSIVTRVGLIPDNPEYLEVSIPPLLVTLLEMRQKESQKVNGSEFSGENVTDLFDVNVRRLPSNKYRTNIDIKEATTSVRPKSTQSIKYKANNKT